MIRRNETVAQNTTTFGARFGQKMQAVDNKADRQDAEVWANIGYETGDPQYGFVSLPFGIPIDTQGELQVRGRDEDFLAFTSARNDLLAAIKKAAETLAPGEEMILAPEGVPMGSLVIQLRRRAQQTESVKPENNRFAMPFNLPAPDAAAA